MLTDKANEVICCGKNKKKAIQSIKNAAMSWNNRTGILDLTTSFQHRLKQIAKLRQDREQEREQNHHPHIDLR